MRFFLCTVYIRYVEELAVQHSIHVTLRTAKTGVLKLFLFVNVLCTCSCSSTHPPPPPTHMQVIMHSYIKI